MVAVLLGLATSQNYEPHEHHTEPIPHAPRMTSVRALSKRWNIRAPAPAHVISGQDSRTRYALMARVSKKS